MILDYNMHININKLLNNNLAINNKNRAVRFITAVFLTLKLVGFSD